MWSRFVYFICLLVALVSVGDAAKILGIFHVPGQSHYFLAKAYMRALAEAGHDVTVVSFFGEKNPPKGTKYRDIVMPNYIEERKKSMPKMDPFQAFNFNPFMQIVIFSSMCNTMTSDFFNQTVIQELINSGEKYDVVVVEQFMNDGMKALANHFGGHLVSFSSIGASKWINALVANPSPSSYVPDVSLSYTPNMTLFQRITNVVYKLFYTLVMNLYFFPTQAAIVRKHLPNVPPLNEIIYNSSLVLLNGHESLNRAVPHVPSMVDIGGFHITPPKKLPKDLQKFLDDAKEGVIYFSLGSNLKSEQLPVERRDAILRVFSKLKQKVLWKWEADVLPGQPSNVKLGKWLPQQEILAHPNVKVFMTHGGLLSTIETIYHGVPIIAIPVYGDQAMNAKNAELDGYGLVMPYNEFSEETLSNLLEEILNNPKYAQNAKKLSSILNDRPRKPLDDAVYWTEYIIRHNGAPHLRVAGLALPWYQYHLLDVYVVLLAIVLVSVVITKKVLCLICSLFKSKKTKKEKKN